MGSAKMVNPAAARAFCRSGRCALPLLEPFQGATADDCLCRAGAVVVVREGRGEDDDGLSGEQQEMQ